MQEMSSRDERKLQKVLAIFAKKEEQDKKKQEKKKMQVFQQLLATSI
jgi:hypothetical protein